MRKAENGTEGSFKSIDVGDSAALRWPRNIVAQQPCVCADVGGGFSVEAAVCCYWLPLMGPPRLGETADNAGVPKDGRRTFA